MEHAMDQIPTLSPDRATPDAVIPEFIRAHYPFTSRFTTINGSRMHYLDEGQGDPVVLLHGNPTWSYLYRDFIRPLAARHRVIVPDHIGFGFSDKPASERAYSLEGQIANALALLDRLGVRQRATLVGQDWGGPTAFGMLLARPGLVRALALMSTWVFAEPSPFHDNVFPWRAWHAPLTGAFLLKRRNVLMEQNAVTGGIHPEHLPAYLYPWRSYDERAAMLAFPRMIPRRPGDRYHDLFQDWESRLRTVDLPVKFFWGDEDTVFPLETTGARLRALFPNATEIEIVRGGRHFLQDQHGARISRGILDFLER